MKGPTLRTLNRPPKYQAPPIGLVGGSSANVPLNPTFENVNISGNLTVLGDSALGDLNAATVYGSSFSTLGRVSDPGVVNAEEVVANNISAVGFYGSSIDVNTAGVVDLNLSGDITQSSGSNILANTQVMDITQSGPYTISQSGTGLNVLKDTRISTITQTATHVIMQSGSGRNVLRDSVVGVIEQYSPNNIIQYSTGSNNALRGTDINGTLTVTGIVDTGNLTSNKLKSDSTVEATTYFRVSTRNLFSTTSSMVQTTTATSAKSLALDAAQGSRYLIVLWVQFSDTSNNSVWKFLGSNRLYTASGTYTYQDHDIWSSSVYYTKDEMNTTWTYTFTTGTTNYSSACPLYIKPFNTATPSTAKAYAVTVQLVYLGLA